MLERYLEPHSPDLDPALDAALACFARHGLTHTSIPDIARELGVSRATMYRQISSTQDAARLLLGRELRRYLESIPEHARDAADPDSIIEIAESLVRFTVNHPLFKKVMGDETMLVGELLPHMPTLLQLSATLLVPGIKQGIAAGALRKTKPEVTADVVVRVAAIAVFVPPPTSLREHLEAILRPMLEPM